MIHVYLTNILEVDHDNLVLSFVSAFNSCFTDTDFVGQLTWRDVKDSFLRIALYM